jgi:D-amino peptidase
MKRSFVVLCCVMAALFMSSSFSFSETTPGQQKLKVFISVDMEGISGLVSWEETEEKGPDYQLFRRIMTDEANAAVEGALEAGATEIVVRDAHGSGRNILPDLLDPEAKLVRDWSGGPLDMMEGIDKTYDAAILIGYHARAGTPDAVLKHTMNLSTLDMKLNGKPVPEAGLNAAIAGYFSVPVVLVTGDLAFTVQAKDLLGNVSTVAVKEGIGKAAKMIHPEKARKMIKAATVEALRDPARYRPFKPTSPVTMELTFTNEDLVARPALFPGAIRTGDRSVAFMHNDLMEVLKFYVASAE